MLQQGKINSMSMFITKRWTRREQSLVNKCFNSNVWSLLADFMDLGFGPLTTATVAIRRYEPRTYLVRRYRMLLEKLGPSTFFRLDTTPSPILFEIRLHALVF